MSGTMLNWRPFKDAFINVTVTPASASAPQTQLRVPPLPSTINVANIPSRVASPVVSAAAANAAEDPPPPVPDAKELRRIVGELIGRVAKATAPKTEKRQQLLELAKEAAWKINEGEKKGDLFAADDSITNLQCELVKVEGGVEPPPPIEPLQPPQSVLRASVPATSAVPAGPAVLKRAAAKTTPTAPTPVFPEKKAATGSNQVPADGRTGADAKRGTTSPPARTVGPSVTAKPVSAASFAPATSKVPAGPGALKPAAAETASTPAANQSAPLTQAADPLRDSLQAAAGVRDAAKRGSQAPFMLPPRLTPVFPEKKAAAGTNQAAPLTQAAGRMGGAAAPNVIPPVSPAIAQRQTPAPASASITSEGNNQQTPISQTAAVPQSGLTSTRLNPAANAAAVSSNAVSANPSLATQPNATPAVGQHQSIGVENSAAQRQPDRAEVREFDSTQEPPDPNIWECVPQATFRPNFLAYRRKAGAVSGASNSATPSVAQRSMATVVSNPAPITSAASSSSLAAVSASASSASRVAPPEQIDFAQCSLGADLKNGKGAFGNLYSVNGGDKPLLMKTAKAGAEKTLAREAEFYQKAGNHPNIAQCWGMQTVGGRQGLVVECIAGPDMSGVMKKMQAMMDGKDRAACRAAGLDRDLTMTQYQGIMQYMVSETAKGVAHLATKDIVHNDIRPDNIMIDAGTGDVKIIDFGSAVDARQRVPNDVNSPVGAGSTSPDLANGILTPEHDSFALGEIIRQSVERDQFRYNSNKRDGKPPSVEDYASYVRGNTGISQAPLGKKPARGPTPQGAPQETERDHLVRLGRRRQALIEDKFINSTAMAGLLQEAFDDASKKFAVSDRTGNDGDRNATRKALEVFETRLNLAEKDLKESGTYAEIASAEDRTKPAKSQRAYVDAVVKLMNVDLTQRSRADKARSDLSYFNNPALRPDVARDLLKRIVRPPSQAVLASASAASPSGGAAQSAAASEDELTAAQGLYADVNNPGNDPTPSAAASPNAQKDALSTPLHVDASAVKNKVEDDALTGPQYSSTADVAENVEKGAKSPAAADVSVSASAAPKGSK